MIKVILADHERIFRIGMASALVAEDDIRIVGQPHGIDQLIHGLETFRPHVVVLSSAFLESISTIEQTCARHQTAILLLEDHGQTLPLQYPTAVQGVMQRSADVSTVVNTIRHLAKNGKILRLTRPISQACAHDSIGFRVRERLSPQELRVVSYVVQGYKNREIGLMMGTNEQAIKNALRKIYDKTGVFGRLELALFVIHHRTLIGATIDAHPTSKLDSIVALQGLRQPVRRPTIN